MSSLPVFARRRPPGMACDDNPACFSSIALHGISLQISFSMPIFGS